jgi:hypothetical protein
MTAEHENYLDSVQGSQLVGSVSLFAEKFDLDYMEANNIVLEWMGY